MEWEKRIENYVRETGFPKSLFISEDGRVVGTWITGNDYRIKSAYYGGYPAGYLRRIRALFPDKRRVLHLFSGKVELGALPGDTVDITVLRALRAVSAGTHIVWLDQVLPMYRKDAFAIDAVIGTVKSTNHRFRVVTIFRRLEATMGAGELKRDQVDRLRAAVVPQSSGHGVH